jgi:hypothetical protein
MRASILQNFGYHHGMLDPAIRLLRYWMDQELTGILICKAIAEGSSDPALSARWSKMAAMERKMLDEICCALGCPVQQEPFQPEPSTENYVRASKIAADFLNQGEKLGSARMADDVSAILDALRGEAGLSPGGYSHVIERLISHEEAWLHFLQMEALGNTATSLSKAMIFLGDP